MNILSELLRLFSFGQDLKEATTAPGWRPRPTRFRKSRTPFQGRAAKETIGQRMNVERFFSKSMRDDRFTELRKQGTKHLNKFSDVERYRSVWCVVKP